MKLFRLILPALLAFAALVGTPATANAQQTGNADMTARIAALPVEKVVEISQKLLDTPLEGNEEVANGCAQIIVMWLTQSDDYTVNIPSADYLSNRHILPAYFAAELINMHRLGITATNEASFVASMKDVLKYYEANKKALGKISQLDKLAKLSPEKLDKKLAEINSGMK